MRIRQERAHVPVVVQPRLLGVQPYRFGDQFNGPVVVAHRFPRFRFFIGFDSSMGSGGTAFDASQHVRQSW